MKQTQVEKEMTLMEENEKKIVLIRHDMRHFLNNILNDLKTIKMNMLLIIFILCLIHWIKP